MKRTNKGKKFSEEWRKRLSLSHQGKKFSEETKKKMSISRMNDKNPAYKGEDAGYRAIHIWVEQRKGKASYCSNDITHKATRYHWANISGEYKRDLDDWHSLCPSCNKTDGIKISERFERRVYL